MVFRVILNNSVAAPEHVKLRGRIGLWQPAVEVGFNRRALGFVNLDTGFRQVFPAGFKIQWSKKQPDARRRNTPPA